MSTEQKLTENEKASIRKDCLQIALRNNRKSDGNFKTISEAVEEADTAYKYIINGKKED